VICLDKDLKLKQSNNLILATHRMNIQQMRLFFYACSQYQGDLDIEVSIDDINRILAYQGGNQREIIKNAIPTLMQSALVHIDDENGERWSIAITDSYIKNDNKTVRFTFNKTVQKELEELRGYTWLYLSNLTGMSSTYAVRIYEFFAMRLGSQNKKDTFDFDLNKLRIYLDCTNKLEDFRNFERTVLKKAEKEINEKTNIKMSYKKIKTGRSITSISFTFKWKSKADVIDVKTEEHQKPMNQAEQMELKEFLKEFE
jgi:plasmid replication initiation protein